MPNQLDTTTADYTSSNLFTISDEKERSLTMSITQSNSFESNNMSNINVDGPELTISLSASSDSIGFGDNCTDLNLKESFGDELDEKKDNTTFDENCEVSVVSSGAGHVASADVSITSCRTNESKQLSTASNNSTQNSKPFASQVAHQGPPPAHGYHLQPYGAVPGPSSHYHPHYQRQYYSNSSNAPQYPGGQGQQYDHRYQPNGPPYNSGNPHPQYVPGMQYQQPNYHHQYHGHPGYPSHGYRHGPPPPHPPHSSSSNGPNSRHFVPNSNSSAMSVSSHGSSRKRTIDGMMDEDAKYPGFTKHRCSSNSSTCSAGTAGNNTSSETLNQMICESPMKRERITSPDKSRRKSTESGTSALSFSGLSMGVEDNHESKVVKSSRPATKDVGVTPVSKNTTEKKGFEVASKFSFDEDNENQAKTYSPEEHSLNKQLRDQSFTPIHSSEPKRETSPSPTFNEQLEIVPQLSWSIADDTPEMGDLADWPKSEGRNASPMSFNGQISPMLFNISPSNEKDQASKSNTKAKCDEMMQMGVLSPTMDDKPSGLESTPSSFSNALESNPKSVEKCLTSPQSMEKNSYQKHLDHRFRMHAPFPAMSPKSSMPPMNSPSYHLTMNPPPTPQNPSYERREDNYSRSMHSGNRDGPPVGNYQSPYPGHVNGQDRIRNLRGRVPGALPPSLHLPPQLPSHPHFLTSPIGTTPRGMMLSSPHARMNSHSFPRSPHVNTSKRKCVPLKTPIPCKFQGDMEKMKTATVPEFSSLVNYPAHMSQKQASLIPDGMRCCVMCGHACPSTASSKNKKGGKKSLDGESRNGLNNSYAIIPVQNKGLCTQCDVNVWVVTNNNLEIKWCKGCKNFRPWAAFGEKGLATKCVRCRERQREKYAAQKEEKDRKKALAKAKALMNS